MPAENGYRKFSPEGLLIKVWNLPKVKFERHLRLTYDDSTIRSLVITKGERQDPVLEGRVDCEDHSPEAGPFELGWRAITFKDGSIEVEPTDTFNSYLLAQRRFTNNRKFDRWLKSYIAMEVFAYQRGFGQSR